MKQFLLIILTLLFFQGAWAQRKMEKLDRGLVAYKTNSGILVSWRVLGEEWRNVSYNLYREGTKINAEPIAGATTFIDQEGSISTAYSVAAVIDGSESERCPEVTPFSNAFFDIELDRPEGGTNPSGTYTYSPNDCSVGDLDGDGDYEIIVKWDPSNSKDNSQSGYTGNVYLDAYTLEGTKLWRIDLGRNIRAGAHYTQFMVFDFNGDGKAEVACKTADATIDGAGTVIGNAKADYRNSSGYILSGPEFLTIFNGETGAAMNTVDYVPARGSVSSWGDSYGNRVDRFLAGVGYLDGQNPSLIMCRGYYTRTVLVAWDWDGVQLTRRWTFDATGSNALKDYTGQGNHQLSIADVDFDGKDEIIYGACAIDDDGKGIYSTRLGHGDALHVSDFDALRPGLEVFGVHESGGNGATFRDAATGEIIWQKKKDTDVGRGLCANVAPENRGAEMWGSSGLGVFDVAGEVINGSRPSINFAIWWDGDENREILDGTSITKWNKGTLFTASGCLSNNSTKSTPNLSADILGDWREEVIFRTSDNSKLRVFLTPYSTDKRHYTLMHDSQYRVAIAWQNTAYNQPPHPSFYMGEQMSPPPPPLLKGAGLIWNAGDSWDTGISANWLKAGSETSFANGEAVSFFPQSDVSQAILLSGNLQPKSVTVNHRSDIVLAGSGSLSGNMELIKNGAGTLTIEGDHSYSGVSMVWNGKLVVNGTLEKSRVKVMTNSTVGGKGKFGNGLVLEHGALLEIGDSTGKASMLYIDSLLSLNDMIAVNFDLSDDPTGNSKPNDRITVDGDLELSGENIFSVNMIDGSLTVGTYTLISFSGNFTGDLSKITLKGALGIPYKLLQNDSAIVMEVEHLRQPEKVVWTGSTSNVWDLAINKNWMRGTESDWFVTNDTVLFTDQANSTNINLDGLLVIGAMKVDATNNYTLSGSGTIAGAGSLVKNGSGRLTINTINQYTGSTSINGGTVSVSGLSNTGSPGPLGAPEKANATIRIDGGKLQIDGGNSETDRDIFVGDQGASIDIEIPGSNLVLYGSFTGNGSLAKEGPGELILYEESTLKGPVTLSKGIVTLNSSSAIVSGLGSRQITIEDATLNFANGINSYDSNYNDFKIADGASAVINLDGRCAYYGTLSGSGDLELYTPYVRSELFGDWSGFEGTIQTTTDGDGGTLLLGNNQALPKAKIALAGSVTMLYRKSENLTLEIGELTGASSSKLGAGGESQSNITWKIGGLNTNFSFDGKITNEQFKNSGASAALVKTGSGKMTLTNSNTYSGGTTVEKGTLIVSNTLGSATGTGAVKVMSKAVLSGNGSLAGPLQIEPGGGLGPGDTGIGKLTVTAAVSLENKALLSIKCDPANQTADQLMSNTSISLNEVILYMTNTSATDYTDGMEFKILQAPAISGTISTIIPASPGENLKWDLSEMNSAGILKVALATGIEDLQNPKAITLYPNPVKNFLTLQSKSNFTDASVRIFDLSGKLVLQKHKLYGNELLLDIQQLEPGSYILHLQDDDKDFSQKIVKTDPPFNR